MKRNDLLLALNAAKSSLVGVDFIPILSHFCFAEGMVYAYDDISAVILDCEGVEHLKGGVRGEMFLGVLQTCAEEITLRQKSETLTLETDNGKVDFPMLPDSEFLFSMPDMSGAFQIPVTEEFLSALALCAATVGRDPRRPEFVGITLALGKKECCMYSTDNVTFSKYTLEGLKGIAPTTLVLPKSTADQVLALAKLCAKDVAIEMACTKEHALFTIPAAQGTTTGINVVSKLLEYKNTDFEKVIREVVPTEGFVEIPPDLRAVVQRACVLLNKSVEKDMQIGVKKGALVTHTKTEFGEAGGALPLKQKIPDVQVTVNAEMLARALACEAVKEIAVGDRAVAFRGDSYLHMISTRAA